MADQPHYQQYPYQQYPNQQYPHPQYPYGQQQEAAAGYGNWNNGAQQAPPQWYRQPAVYAAEGIARAHNWVASQPEDSLSPPPTAKTPFSEYASTVSDHRTIGSHPFPQGPPPRRDQTERICGVKRNVFFIVLAIGLFVLVVGIATGLGVGLALAKSSASTSTAVTPAATR
ncbi:hypothetical protein BJ170DRAFT_342844 [Xylariales sp. AK1849]|nr:hypothetical protein BJ170DRAFT_342844 [Xylariales sp. AK1849]